MGGNMKMKNDEWLWLGTRIINAYKSNGFESAITFGKQGVGKTTYALKVAKEVYQRLGHEPDESWQLALDSLFFELKDALQLMKIFRQNNRTIPIIIFDDAGIWLQKYLWYKEEMIKFYRIYNIIRNIVSGIIFTTPSPNDIAFYVREKGWKLIMITRNGRQPDGTPKAQAKIAVNKITIVKGKISNKVKWRTVDDYTVKLPDWVYKEYVERRKFYEEKLLEELDEILDSGNGTKNTLNLSLFPQNNDAKG
ncbi:ORF9 [Sulfolobus spindle-shaped virus 3]|nr:ORF9 [Sulfolobus spindle-shaped virus 3]